MYFQNYEPNIAICDIGTEFTKMGYATHNSPSFCSNSQTKQNGYVSPLKHSSINDIPSYLQILKNVDRLQTKDIIIVLNNEERKVKSKILEFLYENNLCENLLIHESRVCDLYSYGKTTGLVISLSGSINIVAIVDGLVVSRKDEPFGGYDASQMVRNTFDEIAEYAKGRTSDDDYARHIADEKAREIKEHIFYNSNTTYELGKVLNCADVKEEILKCMLKNINKHVNEIVEGMEDDVKYQMLGNIVLTGGCSEINSMVEMVNEAICKTYPQSKVKISYEKKFHTFVGASVFGSLGSTRCFYVGLKDYEEFGVNILDRKAFEWIKQ